MRVAAGFVVVVMLALIVGSTGYVLSKEYTPRLSVEVKGVPGYIYYNRNYDLTIEYANHGGAFKGPVELSVRLPETFALADQIDDPIRHGERLVWMFDGLGRGEKGSVTFTVRGTLPDDLTNAVYDLPGYVGHTAFVEGFDLKAAIKAGSAAAEVVALADTGLPVQHVLRIIKTCDPTTATGTFDFYATESDGPNNPPPLGATRDLIAAGVACGDTVDIFNLAGGLYFLDETNAGQQTLTGYTAAYSSPCEDGYVPVVGGEPETCEVTNTQLGGTIVIIKDAVPDSPIPFTFTDNIPNCSVGPLTDNGGQTNLAVCSGVPAGQYIVTENLAIVGYGLTAIECTSGGRSLSGGTGNRLTRTATINLSAGGTVTCVFTNTVQFDPSPTPTLTATSTATPTVASTSTASVTPTAGQRGGLGGIFVPLATPPKAVQQVAGATIRPPSTGDAGLRD